MSDMQSEVLGCGQSTGAQAAVSRFMAVATALAFTLIAATTVAYAGNAAGVIGKHASGSSAKVDHSVWDTLLKTYVKPDSTGLNRVDYAAFKAGGQGKLKTYIAGLQKVDPKTLDRPEQFALLANLYNAKTIDIVLDHYPVASIKDISLGGGLFAALKGGPWKAEVLTLAGTGLSLDDIEHGILRAVFKDPRVHYAVNCASIGCPNLQAEAFTGAKLQAQLDAGARAYVNHPRGINVTSDGVYASSIYRWFKEDFGNSDAGVLAHVRKYAAAPLAAKLKGKTAIDGNNYDWKLNDVAR